MKPLDKNRLLFRLEVWEQGAKADADRWGGVEGMEARIQALAVNSLIRQIKNGDFDVRDPALLEEALRECRLEFCNRLDNPPGIAAIVTAVKRKQ